MSLWFRPFEAAFAVVLVDVALTTVSCEIAYDSCLVLLHPCSLAFTQIGSGCLSVCFRVTFSIILSNTASVCSNPLFSVFVDWRNEIVLARCNFVCRCMPAGSTVCDHAAAKRKPCWALLQN